MADALLKKALVMCHPKSGILALDPETCMHLRITTLNNLSCSALSTSKPHLSLKYAVAAITIHRLEGHDKKEDMQVRHATLSMPLEKGFK